MDYAKSGDLIGQRFRVIKLIGLGSFAQVFVAHDLHSGQTVALKMLRPERFGDENAVRRLETREFRLLERIAMAGHSPYVVRLVEDRLHYHQGVPYLVLEYVDGPSLKEWLSERGRLDIKEVARFGAGLARGLSVIHTAGGVHRDLKPSNVRLRNGKTPVLVDLGIARALWETQQITLARAPMTLRYAAPEQRQGLPATPAADVYALGLCLREMLVGRSEEGDDLRSLRPEIPERLAQLIQMCLAEQPEDRPTVQHIVGELDRGGQLKVSRPSLWPAVFFVSSAVFPVHVEEPQESDCVPIQGMAWLRTSGLTATSVTGELSNFDQQNAHRPVVAWTLSNVEPYAQMWLDDGTPGRYEVMGWLGDTCRHFSLRLCEDRAFVLELPNCTVPRSGGGIVGDVNNDGVQDVVFVKAASAFSDRSTTYFDVPHIGATLLRHADGSSEWITQAFETTLPDAYHVEPSRRTGDIDRDGCADFVVLTYATGGACPSAVHIFWGDCQGRFTVSPNAAHVPLPANVSDLGDVDEDGFLDLVTGPDDDGDPGQSFLLRGNGHGFGEAEPFLDAVPEFEEGQDKPGSGSSFLEDVNGDGHLDGIQHTHVGTQERRIAIHYGRGDGSFDSNPDFVKYPLPSESFRILPLRGR
ncbi:MAG TPA: protein kinase [Polyangium sp.]|nr:protein kinase [Polyangium sp.]